MAVNPARLQQFLEGIDYPVSKEELIEHARGRGADRDVIDVLRPLRAQRYNRPADVSEAIGELE
jgi:hypothetical protein